MVSFYVTIVRIIIKPTIYASFDIIAEHNSIKVECIIYYIVISVTLSGFVGIVKSTLSYSAPVFANVP